MFAMRFTRLLLVLSLLVLNILPLLAKTYTKSYSKHYTNSSTYRSHSKRQAFLKSQGLKRVPAGYEVDHITPLARGGADESYNMELLPKNIHKAKTAREAKVYHWSSRNHIRSHIYSNSKYASGFHNKYKHH